MAKRTMQDISASGSNEVKRRRYNHHASRSIQPPEHKTAVLSSNKGKSYTKRSIPLPPWYSPRGNLNEGEEVSHIAVLGKHDPSRPNIEEADEEEVGGWVQPHHLDLKTINSTYTRRVQRPYIYYGTDGKECFTYTIKQEAIPCERVVNDPQVGKGYETPTPCHFQHDPTRIVRPNLDDSYLSAANINSSPMKPTQWPEHPVNPKLQEQDVDESSSDSDLDMPEIAHNLASNTSTQIQSKSLYRAHNGVHPTPSYVPPSFHPSAYRNNAYASTSGADMLATNTFNAGFIAPSRTPQHPHPSSVSIPHGGPVVVVPGPKNAQNRKKREKRKEKRRRARIAHQV